MTILQSLSVVLIIAPACALTLFAYRHIRSENRMEQSRRAYLEALKTGNQEASLQAGRTYYTLLNKGQFGEEQERRLKQDIGLEIA